MPVIIELNSVTSYLRGYLQPNIYKKINILLSYRMQKADFMPSFKNNKWDGRIHLFSMEDLSFPTGLYLKIVKYFNDLNIEYLIQDNRISSIKQIDYQWVHPKIKELHPYQKGSVKTAIEKKNGIIQVATGGGKCLSKNSLILTNEGILNFVELYGNLNKNDLLKNNIILSSPITENKLEYSNYVYCDGYSDSLNVKLDISLSVIGTYEHKIQCVNNINGLHCWKKTSELNIGDYVVISKNNQMFGEDNTLSLNDAYWLGLLCGDGSFIYYDRIGFYNEDVHLINFAKKYCKTNNLDLKINSNILMNNNKYKEIYVYNVNYRKLLLNYGFNYIKSYNKEIPILLRKSKKEILSAFIRGLYETDGYITYEKNKLTINIGLSSEKFIDQLQIILLNYGIVSFKRKKNTQKLPSYILTIYRDFIDIFMSNIGLDKKGHKYRKVKYYLKKINSIKRNSNKDIIPYLHNQIRHNFIVLKKKIGIKEIKKILIQNNLTFNTIRSWSDNKYWRFPSRNSLILFVNLLEKYNIFNEELLQIKKSISNDYYYSKITSINECMSENYDFVVPNTHSFVANGFINHNTVIMSKIVQELGRKTLILVHKLDLLEQARNHLKNALGVEIGYIGDGKLDIQNVTVGTVQTIVRSLGFKYLKFMDEEIDEKKELKEQDKERVRELLRTVNVVIIDECHHVRSETQQNIMNNVLAADYRIGLSATPMRDQGDDLLIEGIFGEILCKISASYLIENEFLIKPEITFNHINHTIFYFYEIVKIDNNNNIIYYNPPPSTGSNTGRRRNIDIMWDDLSERDILNVDNINDKDILYEYDNGYKLIRKWVRYEGATNFIHHIYIKLEEICNAAYNEVLQNEIVLNRIDINNKKIYEKFIRKFKREHSNLRMKGKYAFVYDACITDNEYRNMYIAQLLNLHYINNRSILVLVTRLRHGDNILKILSDDVIFLKGEDDLQTRNDVVEKIKIREIREIIASTIADEGLDLPALDVVIMAGGGTSKTTALQRVGRALRLYKDKIIAYIEEFYDDAQYLSKHSKDRADIYKTEPAFIIKGL